MGAIKRMFSIFIFIVENPGKIQQFYFIKNCHPFVLTKMNKLQVM